MVYRLPPLAALRAFESAARHLSFKKAAEELHVTPAAVSLQIKTLESYLGVSLFLRLTRALELTSHGEAMLPKVREGFDCLAAAVEVTRRRCGSILAVTAPPSFAARWLLPRLPRFSAAHPDVDVRLSSSPTTVDRRGVSTVLDEAMVDPRDGNSGMAIRYGTGNYPGYRVELIFTADCVPVCSPALLRDGTALTTPDDLRHCTLIHDETIDDEERRPNWSEWLKLAGVSGIDGRKGPHFSNAVLAVEAALEGQGVALALRPLVEADVAAGRLVMPFDISVPSPYAYFLVMPAVVADRAPVVAFRDWIVAEAQTLSA